MEITIRIDNGDARVFVKQIFANHSGGVEEGNYVFALPSQATVSDFAVWTGRLVFQPWFWSASVPRRYIPSLNGRRLIRDYCRWESAARRKPSAAEYSALASFRSNLMEPSG